MDNFKIYDKIDNLIISIHNSALSNIPKSHNKFRDRILTEVFDMASNTVRANESIGNLRLKYQKEVIVNIINTDMLLGLIKEMGFIEKKKFMSIISNLNEIKKMVYGWIRSEKKQ